MVRIYAGGGIGPDMTTAGRQPATLAAVNPTRAPSRTHVPRGAPGRPGR